MLKPRRRARYKPKPDISVEQLCKNIQQVCLAIFGEPKLTEEDVLYFVLKYKSSRRLLIKDILIYIDVDIEDIVDADVEAILNKA